MVRGRGGHSGDRDGHGCCHCHGDSDPGATVRPSGAQPSLLPVPQGPGSVAGLALRLGLTPTEHRDGCTGLGVGGLRVRAAVSESASGYYISPGLRDASGPGRPRSKAACNSLVQAGSPPRRPWPPLIEVVRPSESPPPLSRVKPKRGAGRGRRSESPDPYSRSQPGCESTGSRQEASRPGPSESDGPHLKLGRRTGRPCSARPFCQVAGPGGPI